MKNSAKCMLLNFDIIKCVILAKKKLWHNESNKQVKRARFCDKHGINLTVTYLEQSRKLRECIGTALLTKFHGYVKCKRTSWKIH